MSNEIIGQRLAEWRKSNKLSQRALGAALDVSQGFISDIEKGRVAPSRNFLQILFATYRVNPSWILEGQGAQVVDQEPDRSMLGVPISDFVQVQYRKEGTDGPMEDWSEYAFRSAWLRQLNVSQGTCRMMRIVKNDMEPTLKRGGVVLIDPDRTRPDGGIFAFSLEGNVLLRRLAEVDGMVSITADNRAYSSMAAARDRLAIIGQAVWQSSLLIDLSAGLSQAKGKTSRRQP